MQSDVSESSVQSIFSAKCKDTFRCHAGTYYQHNRQHSTQCGQQLSHCCTQSTGALNCCSTWTGLVQIGDIMFRGAEAGGGGVVMKHLISHACCCSRSTTLDKSRISTTTTTTTTTIRRTLALQWNERYNKRKTAPVFTQGSSVKGIWGSGGSTPVILNLGSN